MGPQNGVSDYTRWSLLECDPKAYETQLYLSHSHNIRYLSWSASVLPKMLSLMPIEHSC